MKGLYSGRQIKALATKKAKITRSQTAAQAVKAITKKYGSVVDSGKYFHTGKGVWVKYSLANDSKRTGRLAESKAQWRAQPHKLDYHGIDTKKGVEKKEVKTVKRKFSVGMLKQGKPVGRKGKQQLRSNQKAVVKSVRHITDENILNYAQKYPDGTYPFTVKLSNDQRIATSAKSPQVLMAAMSKMYGSMIKQVGVKDKSHAREILWFKSLPSATKPKEKKRVSRDKLSLAERAPTAQTKPVQQRVTPTKQITINGKEFTINASNAVAFITEMKNKSSKNKLASMIKKAKADEFKGKDVSGEWADIVTFISENMGQSNLKRLPNGPEGFARFMGKKVNYQSVNEKARQIKGKKEEFDKKFGPIEKVKADLKVAQTLLTRAEKDMEDLKRQLKEATEKLNKGTGTYDLVVLLRREIEKQKIEIKEDKHLVSERTKALEARTKQPHPNNRKARIARPKLSKNPAIPNTGIMSQRTKGKLSMPHKPVLKESYVYGSFQRPLWIGFNPGVAFQKVLGPLSNYQDPRWDRNPHDVIITSVPISKEKQYELQLTDLREGAQMEKLVEYVNKFDFLDFNMKGQLENLIWKGYSKAKIDTYIEKGRKMAEKKGIKTSSSSSPSSKFSVARLKQKKPVGRNTKKIPDIAQAVTTKLTDIKNKVYMKNNPFTSLQVQMYNSYSFYDADINKDFNNEVARIDKLIKSKFPSGAPAEVLQAVDRYRRYIYESYLNESKARMTAPSQAVVGPAGYKNFDKKHARADNIRGKSRENLDYAKKQLDLSIRRSNIKVGVEKISQKYGVRVGDKVNLYWTNNYKKYKVPATVSRINENTLVGRLLEAYGGYSAGQEISVPMIGTSGNKWEHIGKDKPKVDSSKEILDKFYEQNKGYFKVGDKVNAGIYGDGVIVKVNKATVVVQVPPVYSGDKGLRKLANHPQAMKKL